MGADLNGTELRLFTLIRDHLKDVPVLDRARFAGDVERLVELGAPVVINEKWMSSQLP